MPRNTKLKKKVVCRRPSRRKGPRSPREVRQLERLVSQLPNLEEVLRGSLVTRYRRCGKATCHCASGKGHPMWSLTFMVDGKKRVEWVPQEWAGELRPLVNEGREFKDAVAEVFAINAQLFGIWRRQQRQKKKPTKQGRSKRRG